jgi:uncharacterized protein
MRRTRFPNPAARALAAVRLVLAGLGLVAACTPHDRLPSTSELPPLERGTVRVETATDTFVVAVEIAQRHVERALGLMERDSLGENEGMLFVFDRDQAGDDGFYMYRTLIPLDIAFTDDDGSIVRILTMEPCEQPVARWCPRYEPGVGYRTALEVNAGWFGARGVAIGDRLTLIRR